MPEITKRDMLDWLDKRLDEANAKFTQLEDGEESRIERSPEAREIRVIVGIREIVKEVRDAF